MERKIGEVFKYKGKTYRVELSQYGTCKGCSFFKDPNECPSDDSETGICTFFKRSDYKHIVFKEVDPEILRTPKRTMTKERFEKAQKILKLIENIDSCITQDIQITVKFKDWVADMPQELVQKFKEFLKQEKVQLEEEFKNT